MWRMFTSRCEEVNLTSPAANRLTLAHYLAARAGTGASITASRLATGHLKGLQVG